MKFLLNLVAAVILAFGLVNARADVASTTGTSTTARVTSVLTNGAYITSLNIANGSGVASVITLFDTPFAPGVIWTTGSGPAWTNVNAFTNFSLSVSNSRTTYVDILGNTATNVIPVQLRTEVVQIAGSTNQYRNLGTFAVGPATTTTLDLSANPLVVVYGLGFTNLGGSNSVSASYFR